VNLVTYSFTDIDPYFRSWNSFFFSLISPWGTLTYPVFMSKPSTHHMHDLGSIVPHIWPEVFTHNQMSQIKYNYYISNVSIDYDDSQ
jgi:hypothetical protein